MSSEYWQRPYGPLEHSESLESLGSLGSLGSLESLESLESLGPSRPSRPSGPLGYYQSSNQHSQYNHSNLSNPPDPPNPSNSPSPLPSRLPQPSPQSNSQPNSLHILVPSSLPAYTPVSHRNGPQRTSYTSQKLKLLPDQYNCTVLEVDEDDDDDDDEEEEDKDNPSRISSSPPSPSSLATSSPQVYSQAFHIKDKHARKDALRLGKRHRELLPRVTGYCTASSYRIKEVVRYLAARKKVNGCRPKLVDECLYTPFRYGLSSQADNGGGQVGVDNEGGETQVGDNQEGGIDNEAGNSSSNNNEPAPNSEPNPPELTPLESSSGNTNSTTPSDLPALQQQPVSPAGDIFLFEYGCIVFWGFSQAEELKFLEQVASRFANEQLSPQHVQTEEFNYYVTDQYPPRIYNDFIALRGDSPSEKRQRAGGSESKRALSEKQNSKRSGKHSEEQSRNYTAKLSISHAIAQSVKVSLFEQLVDKTIHSSQDLPQEIAISGKISMSRKEIMKSIGELFILRININLHGSVLDSPELMWAEPNLEPAYQAARTYLEISQRAGLLDQRLEVISDLLQMLKEQMGYAHGEYLEFIVIVLIAVEIVVAVVNVAVDYFASRRE